MPGVQDKGAEGVEGSGGEGEGRKEGSEEEVKEIAGAGKDREATSGR